MNKYVVVRMIAGLGGAIVGAVLFALLNLPLAFILGSMAGAAIVGNLVGPLGYAKVLRRTGQLIVGTAVGSVLTVEVAAELARLFPVMLATAIAANGVGLLLAPVLAMIAGVDRITALLASLPAGMAEMASLAQELGARYEVVTIIHTLRVVLVVASIPLILGMGWGAGGGTSLGPAVSAGGHWPVLLLVLLLGGSSAYVMARAGVLNPWIVMPMVVGLALVLVGVTIPPVPVAIAIAAQVLIGASLGTRLQLAELRALPRAAAAGILCSAMLIAAMIWGAVPLLQHVTGLDSQLLALAVAPGGLGEMIAAAKVLGIATATIAGFQFVRTLMTNMVAPFLIRRWAGGGRST